MEHVTQVSAALIWRGDRFLACQRPANKTRGLLWEFPGGKREPGETGEEALVRECREELAVTLEVGEVYLQTLYRYPDLTVELTVYEAAIREGELTALEHNGLRFLLPEEVGELEFCPADRDVLEKIKTIGRVSHDL